jgi:cytochrome c2
VTLDRRGFTLGVAAFVAVSALVIVLYFAGAPAHEHATPYAHAPGDPEAGAVALVRMGCGACHEIPGIRVPGGRVGPPLGELPFKQFIAGRLPNTPENAAHFIVDPQGVSPGSAMPDLGVVDVEARNMVAYLATVGGRR